jgi:hypothetical protein
VAVGVIAGVGGMAVWVGKEVEVVVAVGVGSVAEKSPQPVTRKMEIPIINNNDFRLRGIVSPMRGCRLLLKPR